MRNTRGENLSEHSLEVAFVAHALAVIGNKRLGKSYDPYYAAAVAMFHDTSEIITGDMPRTLKKRRRTAFLICFPTIFVRNIYPFTDPTAKPSGLLRRLTKFRRL